MDLQEEVYTSHIHNNFIHNKTGKNVQQKLNKLLYSHTMEYYSALF